MEPKSVELEEASEILAALALPGWVEVGMRCVIHTDEYEPYSTTLLADDSTFGFLGFGDAPRKKIHFFHAILMRIDMTRRLPLLLEVPFQNGSAFIWVDSDAIRLY